MNGVGNNALKGEKLFNAVIFEHWAYFDSLLFLLVRYQHYLCPGIVRDPWSREEDLAILVAHDVVGSKWKEM
jgi:hypothetical protein